MSHTENEPLSLTPEQWRYIDQLVASGAYKSASDVLSAGLRALTASDQSLDRWLRKDVGPTYDAMRRDPTRVIAAETVLSTVRVRHATHVRKARAD